MTPVNKRRKKNGTLISPNKSLRILKKNSSITSNTLKRLQGDKNGDTARSMIINYQTGKKQGRHLSSKREFKKSKRQLKMDESVICLSDKNTNVLQDNVIEITESKVNVKKSPSKKIKQNLIDESVIIIDNPVNEVKEIEISKKANKPQDLADESVIIIDNPVKESPKKGEISVIWSSINNEKNLNVKQKCKSKGNKKPRAECLKFFEDRSPNLEYISLIQSKTKRNKRRMILRSDEMGEDKKKKKLKNSETQERDLILSDVTKLSRSTDSKKNGKLREIVVDGCNVAKAYNPDQSFDEKGIQLIVEYFQRRGHRVTVFVPQHKRSKNRPLLEKYREKRIVIFTPSRKVGSETISSYDDRFILEYATMCDGIVISQDHFRDLYEAEPKWRYTIKNRVLQPTFVWDNVMFPDDPLGRNGPTLDEFLIHN